MPVSVSAGRSPGAPHPEDRAASSPSSSTFWLHGLGGLTYPLWPPFPHLQNEHNYGAQHPVGAQDLPAEPWPGLCVHTLSSAPLPGAVLSNSLMIYTSEDRSIPYTAKDIFNLSQGRGDKVQRPLSTGHSILVQFGRRSTAFSPVLFIHPETALQSNFFQQAGRGDRAAHRPAQAQPAPEGYAPCTVTAGASGDMGAARWEARPSATG